MEELDFEKLIFSEPEKKTPDPWRYCWIPVAAVLVILALAALWPENMELPRQTDPSDNAAIGGAEQGIYGELAPDMVECSALHLSGTSTPSYVTFTPSLDPSRWGAETVTFRAREEGGILVTATSYADPQGYMVGNGANIMWSGHQAEEGYSYVIFTAKVEEHIVGYALIRLQPAVGDAVVGAPKFEAEILGSVIFPPVNGRFQDVTAEYIDRQIEELKQQ